MKERREGENATRTAIAKGGELFDRGRYFEAHDVWEEAWLAESGKARLLLQGLIQIAAALHKVSRAEHARGAVRLFEAGLAKLEGIPDGEAGFALARFSEETRKTLEAAREWSAGRSGPPARKTAPRLVSGRRGRDPKASSRGRSSGGS